MGWYGYGFKPYVSVAKRRARAAREVGKLQNKGRTITPVKIDGLKIAGTFWGKAWCDNMEQYSDYANRLPRGRTYVRNGSVVDLQIGPGKVTALVAGSELYEIDITINRCAAPRWNKILSQCAGKIGSLIELLQGKLSAGVMEIITGAEAGLFPTPKEIELTCSCPDGAYLCKHVAAVLYGVGARLDHQPELLFTLRQVDHLELIARAGDVSGLVNSTSAVGQKTLDAGDLADVFGIEMEPGDAGPAAVPKLQAKADGAKTKRKAAVPPTKVVKVVRSSIKRQKPVPRKATKRKTAGKSPVGG